MTKVNMTGPEYCGCRDTRRDIGPLYPGKLVSGPYGIIGEIRSIFGSGIILMDVLISPIERMSTHSVKVGDQVLAWKGDITANVEVE